jgi:hypothetical protein
MNKRRRVIRRAISSVMLAVAYLRRSGLQTWIYSGGTIDFLRVFAP